MNLQDVLAGFPAADTIVETIRYAYKENSFLQDLELGHDDWTYSIDIFATIRKLLPERIRSQGAGGVEVIQANNTVRFQWGGVPFYIHKIGRAETDDPWQARPSHLTAAGWLGAQMRLSFGDQEDDPPGFVFGHYGTLRDGLRAVRLHAIGETKDGSILSWQGWENLWVADTELAAPVRTQAPAPEPVALPEPELGIRRQEVENDDLASE